MRGSRSGVPRRDGTFTGGILVRSRTPQAVGGEDTHGTHGRRDPASSEPAGGGRKHPGRPAVPIPWFSAGVTVGRCADGVDPRAALHRFAGSPPLAQEP